MWRRQDQKTTCTAQRTRRTTCEQAHRRHPTCHGSVGRWFTWAEACRGVGGQHGWVGVDRAAASGWVVYRRPLINKGMGEVRRFAEVGRVPEHAAAPQTCQKMT
jgi:hypothetical protein